MAKDPAFLFYSKDFYEGTRTLMPEERACYIDLMIYQHQNGGYIPNDLQRVMMYCSGISEATLQATLQAKFKLCDKGWYNPKLAETMAMRDDFSKRQSENGLAGQFFKKAKSTLKASEYNKLRDYVKENYTNKELSDFINNQASLEASLQAMLEAMLKHLANANAIAIVNEDEDKKGGMGEKVEYPFNSDFFMEQWELWKDYKKREHGFKYKTPQSEQAALSELRNKSSGDEETAIKVMHQSMAHGWKGFFDLKESKNGKKGTTAELNEYLAQNDPDYNTY